MEKNSGKEFMEIQLINIGKDGQGILINLTINITLEEVPTI
jgi:hypothetical protein